MPYAHKSENEKKLWKYLMVDSKKYASLDVEKVIEQRLQAVDWVGKKINADFNLCLYWHTIDFHEFKKNKLKLIKSRQSLVLMRK